MEPSTQVLSISTMLCERNDAMGICLVKGRLPPLLHGVQVTAGFDISKNSTQADHLSSRANSEKILNSVSPV